MKTEQQIFDFVKTTKHLAVVGADNFDSLFEAAFDAEYPGLKVTATSYQGEHQEDEVFECNNTLVAWVNWQTGSFYVVPTYKKPSLKCSLESVAELEAMDTRVEGMMLGWKYMHENNGVLTSCFDNLVAQYNRYHELKANPSAQLITVARNLLIEIGKGRSEFNTEQLKCTKGELWYLAHLIEDYLWERNLYISLHHEVMTIHHVAFGLKARCNGYS